MDRLEALLAAVDWTGVEGGRPGNHTGPATDVPIMVGELWHAEAHRRWSAVDYLETTGLEFGETRPATVPLIPVVVAALTDSRSAHGWVFDFYDPQLPVQARLLDLLAMAATAPAWGGTDEELRA